MGNSCLLVVDTLDTGWIRKARQVVGDQARLELVTLGISEEPFRLNPGVEVLDTSATSREAENEVRKFVPALIEQLSGAMRTRLTLNGVNYWRYLEVSEKSLWRGQLVHRLYALARLRRLIDERQPARVVLGLRDSLLAATLVAQLNAEGVTCDDLSGTSKTRERAFLLAYWTAALKCLVFTTAKKIWLSAFCRLHALESHVGGTAYFTFFPFFWSSPFSKDRKERFFQGLLKSGEGPGNFYLGWLFDGKALLKGRVRIKEALESERILPLESFLTMRGLLSVLNPRVYFRAKACIQEISQNKSLRFNDFGILRMVSEDVWSSWVSSELFRSILIESSMNRAVALLRPKALCYRLEFQPFEYAILNACKGRTTTVGLQHAAVSKNFLSYVFPDGALKSGDPLVPDYIFATGESSKQLLVAGGYPASRISIVGPLRYESLLEYVRAIQPKSKLRRELRLPESRRIIFIAASLLYEETASMVRSLLEAIRGRESELFLMIKTHPSVPMGERLKPDLMAAMGTEGFRIVEGVVSFYDYLYVSDVVLMTGSTLGVEAIALGVLPICYECFPQYGNNPLTEIPESSLFVHDRASLKEAIELAFSDRPDRHLIEQNWNRSLKFVFNDLSADPKLSFKASLKRTLTGVENAGR